MRLRDSQVQKLGSHKHTVRMGTDWPLMAIMRSSATLHFSLELDPALKGNHGGELCLRLQSPTDLETHRGLLIFRRQGAAFGELFHVAEHLLK